MILFYKPALSLIILHGHLQFVYYCVGKGDFVFGILLMRRFFRFNLILYSIQS